MYLLYSFLLLFYANSSLGGNVSVSEIRDKLVEDFARSNIQELLNWEAPTDIQKDFPYYLTGYDNDNVSIWFIAFGHWDVRKVTDQGTAKERQLRKYLRQMLAQMIDSSQINSTDKEPVSEFNILMDLEGYGYNQISSPKTLGLLLWFARQMFKAWEGMLKHGYIINSNFVFGTAWELIRPLLGPNTFKIQVFGSSKEKWMPTVLQNFPRSAIPERYGGTKDHKPVEVYG